MKRCSQGQYWLGMTWAIVLQGILCRPWCRHPPNRCPHFNSRAEVHPLWGRMATHGVRKRQVLFGGLRVGAIHELPLPKCDPFGHGPCVARAIHESPPPVVGWDEEKCQWLCQGFVDHPWRLPKKVTCAFDRLSTQISHFLHPRPRFSPNDSFESG